MKLFIIEDEVPIREELTQFFEKYGFQCESSDDFHGIAQLALASGADLILLDINLPCQDGFQVCREIRQSSHVPVIVLTSRNTDFDELMSLNIGADDFVSKPYNAQVLLARIQKLLSRAGEAQDSVVLTHKGLTLNLLKAEIGYNGQNKTNVSMDGDGSILEYLASRDADLSGYAENMEQISIYEADFTYGSLFEGQNVELWPIDEGILGSGVSVLAVSDFNRALKMQGKEAVVLTENEYLLNCNYKGTFQYAEKALENHAVLVLSGIPLQRASDTVLEETYFMTSVGNNDRGTLVVPDAVARSLTKDVNVLLVQYRPEADSDAVLQKMIPIGLDDTHGYRYAEKNMMYDMFYGLNALISFLCCYIGLIFLLICAALLALKQLTETTDNIYRYGLLQKLGAKKEQINRTLLSQTAIFFAAPLAVAGVFSAVLMRKAMEIAEEFMNIHISTNLRVTVALFLVVYGSYFLATYLSCKRMVTEYQR